MPTARTSAASSVLMVRPDHFAHNPESAASNAFAHEDDRSGAELRAAARAEYDQLAAALRARGVEVHEAPGVPGAPDAVFPNNWVSFHRDGTAVLYPMASATRRREVRPELVESLRAAGAVPPGRTLDLTYLASEALYLEGTGSLVLDRVARVAYACRSPRTDERALRRFCDELGYEPVLFDARDPEGRPIYHTNVMLALGTGFAVLGTEAVAPPEREPLRDRLAATGRVLIELDQAQLAGYAANLLELRGGDGAPLVVLSARAHAALRRDQRAVLSTCADLLPVPLDTIERVGGGSARCMLAELSWYAGPAR